MMRLLLAAALALSGSLVLHGAGMLAFRAPADPQLAGGAATVPPLLGDSFADLSQGMAVAVAPAQAMMPSAVAPAAPVAAPVAGVAAPTPDGIAPLASPELAARPPEAAAPAPAPPPAAAPVPAPLAAVPPPAARPPARPAATAPLAPVRSAEPKVAPRPEAPAPKADKAPRTPKAPKADTADTAPPPAARGGDAAARKGTATGSEGGAGTRSRADRTAEGDGGQAAQASYGSRVMRKIASTRKKTTGLRGAVIIAFSIAADGRLASVRVARSSGSAELDAVGLDHIRRAAPFPAPPAGGPARFSVEFLGR